MSEGYFDFTITRRLALKIAMCEAQNWRCCYCKFRVELIPGETDAQNAATFEHLLPKKDGGTDDDSNLVIACSLCNAARNRGNCYRFERVVLKLLEDARVRATWHAFDEQLRTLLRYEIRYHREFEKIRQGKPSAVRRAKIVQTNHKVILDLVRRRQM